MSTNKPMPPDLAQAFVNAHGNKLQVMIREYLAVNTDLKLEDICIRFYNSTGIFFVDRKAEDE